MPPTIKGVVDTGSPFLEPIKGHAPDLNSAEFLIIPKPYGFTSPLGNETIPLLIVL